MKEQEWAAEGAITILPKQKTVKGKQPSSQNTTVQCTRAKGKTSFSELDLDKQLSFTVSTKAEKLWIKKNWHFDKTNVGKQPEYGYWTPWTVAVPWCELCSRNIC